MGTMMIFYEVIIIDGIVKSPSVDFLLTETEKRGFRFTYKSMG